TICIVSQFTGARSARFSEEDLTEQLRTHFREYLPDLEVVECNANTDAKVWLEVNLTVRSDETVYGFTRIEFSRDVMVARTGFKNEWQVWEDIITFFCSKDPAPDVSYNMELHSKKLCAWMVLAREYGPDGEL
ncbi:MAG: hypothetical protein V3T31_03785, partial [candidate division Zixibacteria bacterium]